MGLVSDYPLLLELLVLFLAAFGALFFFLQSISPAPRPPTKNETSFVDCITKEKTPFPSLLDESPAEVELSIVIPAYNESKRLPLMLAETFEYLQDRKKKTSSFTYEIIVVNDGSTDDTDAVVRSIAMKQKLSTIRVMNLEHNRGKGGAVTQGMMVARGQRLLFVDADGATKFSDLDKLEAAMDRIVSKGQAIVVGSRAHMVTSDAVVKRSFIRNFLMRGFHTLLFVLGIGTIKDTQCGFKLISRKAAQLIFPNMHVEGWIFDIELLLLGYHFGVPIQEVPVTWHEVDGSKVSLLKDSIKMLLDLLNIRLNYLLGVWQVNASPKRLQRPKSD
ncbi:dolichyl-phosphate beta-glucosyltransferase Alg5 [Polychytrium aggregatum]|uniref:dolichyl-phosphate beta-glucosyltransferase Alg5 n=1 Tax=Polychytrium aggregatum TaxID=110093 RepID=UPI0022FDFEAC|nr:dolichyl-phosphate beta-glucosyltransferase Alg5 [Polychytrium aggregatum]KAI9205490.1 dolichyl-phosphate beta-glucosyltransferase Alg5 [Polychytrium aggregatum]